MIQRSSIGPAIRIALISVLICTAATVAAAEGSRQFALLVGCTEYPYLLERHGKAVYLTSILLRGPENDVRLMRKTLMSRLGVPPSHITSLAGWSKDDPASRPTRANILAHLTRLARTVRKGDFVIIQLAGHGSQQIDTSGDELDGLDEIFLPADVTDWDRKKGRVTNSISDDELGEHLDAIRGAGARVWVIMDCCHSGTGTRGAVSDEIRPRKLDPAFLGVPEAPRSRGGSVGRDQRSELADPDAGDIVAFYGAPSYRTAPEMPLPRGSSAAEPHGLLSYMIAAQLSRLGGGITFEELYAQVVAAYQSVPYHGATPQADGNLRLPVAADAEFAKGGPVLLIQENEDEELVLENAGAVHGLAEGTVLAIYEPGRPGQDDALLGYVVVEEVELTRAVCVPLDREGAKLPKLEGDRRLCPVVIAERPFGDHRLKLVVVEEDGKVIVPARIPDEIGEQLAANGPRFPIVSTVEAADWILEMRGTKLLLRPVRASGATRPFVLERDDLLSVLSRVFRVENLKRLAAGGMLPSPEDGLRIEVQKVGTGGTRKARNGEAQKPGDRVQIVLQNETGEDYDIWIFFIDADYGLVPVFPSGRHSSPRLGHRETAEVKIGPYTVTDDTQGTEHLLILALPREPGSMPVWLDWLAQDRLERLNSDIVERGGGQGGPLGSLLDDLAFGTRMRGWGVASDLEASMALLTWRTEWGETGAPASFGEHVAENPAPVERDPAAVPDAWNIGPRVALSRTGVGRPIFDVLLAGAGTPDTVFIDLTGRDAITSAEGLADRIGKKAFDAEIAFRFEAKRSIVWYDRGDDGAFDLVLIDDDHDGTADRGFSRRGEKWSADENLVSPWLSTSYLEFLKGSKAKARARDKIRRIVAR